MQRLVEFGYPVESLKLQHRMIQSIASFPRRFSYHDATLAHLTKNDRLNIDGQSLASYIFFDVAGQEERDLDGAICNTAQAAFVLELLQLARDIR